MDGLSESNSPKSVITFAVPSIKTVSHKYPFKWCGEPDVSCPKSKEVDSANIFKVKSWAGWVVPPEWKLVIWVPLT